MALLASAEWQGFRISDPITRNVLLGVVAHDEK